MQPCRTTVELRLPTDLTDEFKRGQEKDSARQLGETWAQREGWTRFTLASLAFREHYDCALKFVCDPPERHAVLHKTAVLSWLDAHPPEIDYGDQRPVPDALVDFPHSKYVSKKRKSPDKDERSEQAAPSSPSPAPQPAPSVTIQEIGPAPSLQPTPPPPAQTTPEPFLPDRYLLYMVKEPRRIVSVAPEQGNMSSKLKPARVLAELTTRPLSHYQTEHRYGYWVIPVTPTTCIPLAPSLPHPTASEVTWTHLHLTTPPPIHSTSRTLSWSKSRLVTLWRRLESAAKNFGDVQVHGHFLGDLGSREEVRLYCSGRRALLWRALLNTLHPYGSVSEEGDRWFKGCGLVWRAQDGTAVMVA